MVTAVTRLAGLNQFPPGLWFDEAWVSIVARDWGNEVYYSASFGGMHPAIVYLTRPLQWLTNQHPLAIRYTIAILSTATIPLAFFALRALFSLNDTVQQAGQIALFSAVGLTLTYPFLHFSRLGFESILPAPAALIAVWLCAVFLKRQLNTPRLFDPFVLWLGSWLGICIYTFDTGRFIPLAIAFAIIFVWLSSYKKWPFPIAFGQLTAITLISTIVAFPILRYFWENWADFTTRAQTTTISTFGAESIPLAILQNIGRTLGGLILFGWGDQQIRHNLPGRPVFDIALAIFLVIGTIVLIRQRKKQSTIVLLAWLVLTLLPVVLTDGAPTYTRIFGAIPALAAVVGLGASQLWEAQPRFYWAIPILFLTSAILVTIDYTVRWPQTAGYHDAFQTGEWDIAQTTVRQSENTAVFFLPRRPYLYDPIFDLAFYNQPIRGLTDTSCLAYRPEEKTHYVLNSQGSGELIADLEQQFGTGSVTILEDIQHRTTTERLGRVVEIDTTSQVAIHTSSAQFGEQIRLLGIDQFSSPVPNTEMTLTLHWQAVTDLVDAQHDPADPFNYTLFIHLYGPDGLIAQSDGQPCWQTRFWHAGDTLIDTRRLQLPPDLPTGEYSLEVGWYHPTTQVRRSQTQK